jgi:hypothetical protein
LSGVARQQVSFFCTAKRKKPKKRPPRCRIPPEFPALLTTTGGNQARKGLPQHHKLLKQLFCCETRSNKPHKPWLVAELKQVIAEISRYASAARCGTGELKTREICHSGESRNPEVLIFY